MAGYVPTAFDYMAILLFYGYPVILGLWTYYKRRQLRSSLKVMLYLFVLSFYASFLSLSPTPFREIALLGREYLWFLLMCPVLYIPFLILSTFSAIGGFLASRFFLIIHPLAYSPPMIDYRIHFVIWCAIFAWYYIFNETKKKGKLFNDWFFEHLHWRPPNILFAFLAFGTFPAIAVWKRSEDSIVD